MGKVCVITGASQGIGRAAAIRMSREPGRLTLVLDRPQARAGLEGTGARARSTTATQVELIPLRPDRPRRHPGARRAHPSRRTAASTSCSTSRATRTRSRCSTRAPTTSSQTLHHQRLRDARCSSARSSRYMQRPAGQDPQRGVHRGDHLAPGLARLRLVQGGRRVALGDARRRAGGQRHQGLQHLARPDRHGAPSQARAARRTRHGSCSRAQVAGRHRPADERRREARWTVRTSSSATRA